MPYPYIVTYWLSVVLFAGAAGMRILGWRRVEKGIFGAAAASNGLTVVFLTLLSGHWPVFNLFESFLLTTFTLSVMVLFLASPGARLPDARFLVQLEIILLLAVTLFAAKAPSSFQYDHDFIWSVLFHAFRYLALGVMLFASALFIHRRLDPKSGIAAGPFQQGRNVLILGAILFLIAEYLGILWCRSGWGEFWMWNEGFFQSTWIVLYLMLAFHIPGRTKRADGIRSLIGAMSGFVMLAFFIMRSIPR